MSLRTFLRPRKNMAIPTTLSPILLLCATILLVLVSLSAPIIKSIYLLNIHAEDEPGVPLDTATQLNFGVWGYCASIPAYKDMRSCSPLALGYVVPDDFLALTGQRETANFIVQGLTYALALHPVCAAFALLALLPGFASLCTFAPHAWGIAALTISFLGAILTSIAAAIDIALVAIAKNRLDAAGSNLTIVIGYGNAVWMTLAAAVILWFEVFSASLVVCDCCGFGIEHEAGRERGVHVNDAEKTPTRPGSEWRAGSRHPTDT